MALSSHFCLLVIPKYDLGDVENVIMQGVEGPEKKFLLLAHTK
jgi:hypothetical protein